MPVSRKLINLILWFSILIITCNFAICDALAPSPGANGVELSEVPGIYTLEGETGKVILIIREDNKYQQVYEGFDGERYIGGWNDWELSFEKSHHTRIIFYEYIKFFDHFYDKLIEPLGSDKYILSRKPVEYDREYKVRIVVSFDNTVYYNKK